VTRFIAERILHSITTLVLLLCVTFFLVRLSGDPLSSLLPANATADAVEQVRHQLGLDQPLWVQFGIYIKTLLTGDLGRSIATGRPVRDLIGARLVPSGELIVASLIIALAIAVPAAVISATHRGGLLDRLSQSVAFAGVSAPHFWLGLLLINLFAVRWGILPAAGLGSSNQVADPQHLLLPALTLGAGAAAVLMRLLRSSLLDVLDSDYIKLARIKGVPESRVIWVHGLRNSLIPVLTYTAVVIAGLITGGVTTEVVFNWPGLGQLAYQGIVARDFPLIQGVVLLAAVIVVTTSLVVDVLYARVDPRIRLH
jgi:peptide/nickel transport system permease protein